MLVGEGVANTQNALSPSSVRDRVIAVAFNRAEAKLRLLFFHGRITDSYSEKVGSCLVAIVGKVDVGKAMVDDRVDCFWGGINRHGEN